MTPDNRFLGGIYCQESVNNLKYYSWNKIVLQYDYIFRSITDYKIKLASA